MTKKASKETKEPEVKVPKKRGRKPKEKVYSVSHDPVVFSLDNYTDNLLSLDKLKKSNILQPQEEADTVKEFEPYESILKNYKNIGNSTTEGKLRETNNNIAPVTSTEFKPKELEIKDRMVPDIYTSDIWPRFTDIHCWWCCFEFDTVPIPTPVKLGIDNKLYVKGCFCSFNCMKSFSYEKKMNNEYLITYLLNKMIERDTNGMKSYRHIKKAPDRYFLRIFGGPMSIETFRKNFIDSVSYNILPYPVYHIPDYIEKTTEKGSIFIQNDNKNVGGKFHENLIKYRDNKLTEKNKHSVEPDCSKPKKDKSKRTLDDFIF